MAYKISDRAQEWTTYAGIVVGALSAAAPQFMPHDTWCQVWQAAQLILAAALVFLPQSAGATAVENDGLVLLRQLSSHLPPEYTNSLTPIMSVLTAAVLKGPQPAAPVAPPAPAPVVQQPLPTVSAVPVPGQ